MKYTPPYHIELGSIYEYSEESHAYVHAYKKSQITHEHYWTIQQEIKKYNEVYDKNKDLENQHEIHQRNNTL